MITLKLKVPPRMQGMLGTAAHRLPAPPEQTPHRAPGVQDMIPAQHPINVPPQGFKKPLKLTVSCTDVAKRYLVDCVVCQLSPACVQGEGFMWHT